MTKIRDCADLSPVRARGSHRIAFGEREKPRKGVGRVDIHSSTRVARIAAA